MIMLNCMTGYCLKMLFTATLTKVLHEDCKGFFKTLPAFAWEQHPKPAVKAFCDELQSIIRDHRKTKICNERTSCIKEKVSAVDEMFDSIIEEKRRGIENKQ